MREIKFRVWDKLNEEMRVVEGIEFDGDGVLQISCPGECWRRPEEFELMQFTGLYDKNGKEIYEGDIVDIGISLDRKMKTYISVVKYDDEMGCFKVEHPNIILLGTCEKLEIIGNIYENPELVKENEQ